MTRINAFLTHLGISFLIFLVLLYFIIFEWYPDFLFTTDGGWQGIRIIAGVDLVLGPLLTLIVFKPGKPGLKFDLFMIALFQASALTWGTWATYSERPYITVFAEDSFMPLTKEQFLADNKKPWALEKSCHDKPCLIFSNTPEDFDSMQKLRSISILQRKPIHAFSEYYVTFGPEVIPRIKKESLDASKIINENIDSKIKEQFSLYNNDEKYLLLRIHSRYKKLTAVFDTRNLKIVDTINYSPPLP